MLAKTRRLIVEIILALGTRERLIEEAARLFADVGFDRVTTREICRAAHVNSGTLYFHFSDKGELYREVVDRAVTRGVTRITQSMDPRLSPEARLEQWCVTALEYLEEDSVDLRLADHVLYGHEPMDLSLATLRLAVESFEALANCLEELSRPEDGDRQVGGRQAAYIAFSLVQGLHRMKHMSRWLPEQYSPIYDKEKLPLTAAHLIISAYKSGIIE